MPEPLSQEVEEQRASQFSEKDRAEVARGLLDYQVAPINFGRLRMLEAAKGSCADLARLVEMGNRYGEFWEMNNGQND